MPIVLTRDERREIERLKRKVGELTAQLVLAQATLAESEADLAKCRATLATP